MKAAVAGSGSVGLSISVLAPKTVPVLFEHRSYRAAPLVWITRLGIFRGFGLRSLHHARPTSAKQWMWSRSFHREKPFEMAS